MSHSPIVRLPNGNAILAESIKAILYAEPVEGRQRPRVLVRYMEAQESPRPGWSHITEVINYETEDDAIAIRDELISQWERALAGRS